MFPEFRPLQSNLLKDASKNVFFFGGGDYYKIFISMEIKCNKIRLIIISISYGTYIVCR